MFMVGWIKINAYSFVVVSVLLLGFVAVCSAQQFTVGPGWTLSDGGDADSLPTPQPSATINPTASPTVEPTDSPLVTEPTATVNPTVEPTVTPTVNPTETPAIPEMGLIGVAVALVFALGLGLVIAVWKWRQNE